MSEDFNFFKPIDKKNKFHYKLILTEDIKTPADYDFRSEYYVEKDSCWYFNRELFFWRPAFRYDFLEKAFYFNKAFFNLPFKLGGIFTVGEQIVNVIELDLFLSGYVIMRGIGLGKKGKNIGISAPGFNGKTTLLKKLLSGGYDYIAEDYLIMNLSEGRVYPTCPLLQENFWRRRGITSDLKELIEKGTVVEKPVRLDHLFLVQNSENPAFRSAEKNFVDFLLLNSLYFINNLFVKSIIYHHGLASRIFDQIQEYKKFKDYQYVEIRNFNYDFLEKI